MTRIIGGVAGGRRLAVPPGLSTRPTADRAREALFSALEAMAGSLTRAAFLDLYAGSGAVGLEALSRGAARVVLVESEPRTLAVLRANVAAVGLPGAEVVAAPVARTLARPAPEPFDVVFADPPYAVPDADVTEIIRAAVAGGWAAPDAVVVVERSARGQPFPWPACVDPTRSRRYGEAMLWYGRAAIRKPTMSDSQGD